MRTFGTIEFGTATHDLLAQLKEWFHLVPMQTGSQMEPSQKADFALVQKLMGDDCFVCIIAAYTKCQTE